MWKKGVLFALAIKRMTRQQILRYANGYCCNKYKIIIALATHYKIFLTPLNPKIFFTSNYIKSTPLPLPNL